MNSDSFKNVLSDNPKSARSKTFAEMYQEREMNKVVSLTASRKQKLQFFAQQARDNPSLGYGSPGSNNWILGVVKFFKSPNITPNVVKTWLLERDDSLRQGTSPSSPSSSSTMTRSKTSATIRPSSKRQDILKMINKASPITREPTFPKTWYKFFKKSVKSETVRQSSTSNSPAASASTTTSQSHSTAATATTGYSAQHSPAEEIIPGVPDLQLGDGCLHFDLLRASIDTNNQELSMEVIGDLEKLYKYILDQLQRIVGVANTNSSSIPTRFHGH